MLQSLWKDLKNKSNRNTEITTCYFICYGTLEVIRTKIMIISYSSGVKNTGKLSSTPAIHLSKSILLIYQLRTVSKQASKNCCLASDQTRKPSSLVERRGIYLDCHSFYITLLSVGPGVLTQWSSNLFEWTYSQYDVDSLIIAFFVVAVIPWALRCAPSADKNPATKPTIAVFISSLTLTDQTNRRGSLN